MTQYDQKFYICDPRVVNWKQYYVVYAIGAAKYLLHDPLENLEQARKRLKRLKYSHYTLKYTCITIILYICYILLTKFVV